MIKFINNLLSANSAISSKRFISLVALVLFTAVVITAFFGITVPEVIVYSLVGLIMGGSALTLIGKDTKIESKDE